MSGATAQWLGAFGLWCVAFAAATVSSQDPAPVRAVRLRTAEQGPFTELRVGSTTLRAAPNKIEQAGSQGDCCGLCESKAQNVMGLSVGFE